MTEVKEAGTFVLKNNRGNFVGINSIYYNKKSKLFDYSYSEYLTNGFYTYQCKENAKQALLIIQEMSKIKNGIEFHFEEINRDEVLINENRIRVPKNPFQHEYYNEEGIRVL